MQFKALHSSSPHIQTKTPTVGNRYSYSSPLNYPFNIKFNHCPQTPFDFSISKYIPLRKSHKLRCSSATPELETAVSEDNEGQITVSEGNEDHISSQVPEMVEPTSGSLSNQGLWDQMVEIIKFSGPAAGIWICGPLMSLIDTAVIGQGSSVELAALGPGTVLCDYLGFVFMFLSVATSNMVATSLARKDEDKVQHQISMLMFLGLASGLMMLVLTKVFGVWALTGFVGAKNMHLVPAANTYVQIRALAWPAILVGNIAQSASLAMKDSLGPLKALLIASVINGVGDVVLCTFLGYGIAGAAWATAASQIVAAYTMVDSLNKKGYNGLHIVIPSLTELQEVFTIAAPVFITMMSKVGFYALMIYFATSMGTVTVAAHQVMGQIYHMCSVWGEPLSQTAQSFMPELLFGTERNIIKARTLLRSLLIIGGSGGLFLGTIATSVLWLFPNFFTADLAVIGEMHKIWVHFSLALCITPCILPCEGTLLAGRDLKFISSSMSGCFAVGALVLLVASNQGLGLVGCWTALVGFQWARFTLSFRRLLSPNGLLYTEDLQNFWLPKLKAA